MSCCPKRTRTRIRTSLAAKSLRADGAFESEEEYSHVGGYPFFVQNDPRDEFKELRGHTGEPADYRLWSRRTRRTKTRRLRSCGVMPVQA